MDAAISPAINAFMETYRSVAHIWENESHGHEGADGPVPVRIDEPKEQVMNSVAQALPPSLAIGTADMPSILAALSKADLNDIGMSMLSGKVAVAGMLDLKGLKALKRKIAGLEALLASDDEDEDDDDDL
jgi:hypothetical protein